MLLHMQTRLKRLATETSGQEVAEAALVLPIAFLILLGVFWFGRAYNVYATVAHAAADGARFAGTPTCAGPAAPCTNSLPTDTQVFNFIVSILQASKLDPSQLQPYTPPTFVMPSTGCNLYNGSVLICRAVPLNNSTSSQACSSLVDNPSTPQACGTMVSFKYRFAFPFTANYQLISLPAAAEARLEN